VLVSHVGGRAQMRLAVETYRGSVHAPDAAPFGAPAERLRSVALRMSLHSAASGSDRPKSGIAFATGVIGNEAGNIDNGQILAGPGFTCSSSQSF
jgi:hypothetical protein